MGIKKKGGDDILTKELISQLSGDVKKSEPLPRKGGINVVFADPYSTLPAMEVGKDGKERPSLTKSILNVLNGGPENTIERLAFETNPGNTNTYAALYRNKLRLLPDSILKRLAIQDSLVAAICNARSAQLQAFGRVQPDRHSTGFKLEPRKGLLDRMSSDEKEEFQKRVERAEKLISTCGHTNGLKADDQLTFSQYLGMSTRNAIVVGRLATEIIWAMNVKTQEMEFHSFRPIDGGTIYKAAPYKESGDSVRAEALHLLEQIKNKDFEKEKFKADEYAWIQVVEGRPVQAFTDRECLVHNFYAVTDVELDGYPVTPMDSAISDITTHLNINTHNKLYFQSGRAAKGMLIIQSDDVDERVLSQIKHQFNASINSAGNSHRMPVFGVGKDDQIMWTPIDTGSRDMEFQYLSDTNSRVILSAFQMSPEELPGYAHLSRGTNNQALSESNNEYKLEAARDVGIRPLVSNFEDFVNTRLLPLIDEKLSKLCTLKFVGLDAETPEKESIRVQQDMPVHMTMNEVLQTFEKKPVGLEIGGEIPLNPAYLQNLDKYFSVGEVLERFCGKKGASQDPSLAYFRDPFWHQWQAFLLQKQQMDQQQQMQQQQAAQGQPPGGPDQGQGGPPPPDQGQPQEGPPQPQGEAQDLTRSLDQLTDLLSKGEAALPPSRRRLLHQHRRLVEDGVEGFRKDLEKLGEELQETAEKFLPKDR